MLPWVRCYLGQVIPRDAQAEALWQDSVTRRGPRVLAGHLRDTTVPTMRPPPLAPEPPCNLHAQCTGSFFGRVWSGMVLELGKVPATDTGSVEGADRACHTPHCTQQVMPRQAWAPGSQNRNSFLQNSRPGTPASLVLLTETT